jgi:hypothetical protein
VRALATLLVLAHCAINGLAALLTFPGTNGFYGITNHHAITAYSLLHDRALAGRQGDFTEWWAKSEASHFRYIPPREVEGSLKKSRPAGIAYIYPPGYPIYLFLAFLAGGRLDYDLALGIQAASTILGVPILLLITGRLLRRSVEGYAAAACYGLFLYPIAISQYVLPDGLMPFFGALFLAATAWAAARDRLFPYAIAGLVIGLAANFRSDFLAVAPFFALGVWRARQTLDFKTLTRIGISALAVFVALVPYGIIQAKGSGRFRFSTPALGSSLWEALGESPNPCGAITSDYETEVLLLKAGLTRLTPEGERYLMQRWRKCASRHPRWFLGSIISRQSRVLKYWEFSASTPTIPALSDAERMTFLTWRRNLESAIRITPSQYRRQTGNGKVSWALHHPGDFFRAVLCRMADSLGRAGPYLFRLRVPRLEIRLFGWQLDLFSLLRVSLFVGAVAALVFRRLGLLLGAIPLAYFVSFSFLHVEWRYLVGTLAPLAYLGCHGLAMLPGLWRSLPKLLKDLFQWPAVSEGRSGTEKESETRPRKWHALYGLHQ